MSESTWTPNRVHELRRLVAERFSAGSIARQLGGVSREAVCAKVWRMGLTLEGADAHRQEKKREAKNQTLDAQSPRGAPCSNPGKRAGRPWRAERSEAPEPLDYESMRQPQTDCEPMPFCETPDAACTWPVERYGAPGSATMLVCSAPALAGRPYCRDHWALAWTSSPARATA